MTNIDFNKTYLDNILTELGYYEHFKNNYLGKIYSEIDYGKRMGKLSFENFFDAAEKNPSSTESFNSWNETLISEDSTEEDLLCTVLEIFVWGDVLRGNVKKAVELYKTKQLKTYIKQIANRLKENNFIQKKSNNEIDIIWSSGWTKVYSFIDTEILIYDSRVSAFLNHTLTHNTDYANQKLETLKQLSKHLFTFEGAEGRERLVDKKYGFRKSSPNNLDWFNANLISSWIVQLLQKKLGLKADIPLFERAFFMLGFDLKQIK